MAQALPALLTAISGTGAAAGAATLTAAQTALSIGSTVIGTVATLGQSQFNARVARNNAQVAEENAQKAILESQESAQDQDIAARGELGSILASAGANGLAISSASIQGRRRSVEDLARRDRTRIREEGNVEAERSRTQAADFRGEARQARSSGSLALVEAPFKIGTSLISGASIINRRRARALGRGV